MTTKKIFEEWTPSVPESELETAGMLSEVDPRVDSTHINGVVPPPPNPPPPKGWVYWKKQPISRSAGQLAQTMLHDAQTFPMGSFVRTVDHDTKEIIGYRVEWHDFQGATGKKGCFRGVNLLRRAP